MKRRHDVPPPVPPPDGWDMNGGTVDNLRSKCKRRQLERVQKEGEDAVDDDNAGNAANNDQAVGDAARGEDDDGDEPEGGVEPRGVEEVAADDEDVVGRQEVHEDAAAGADIDVDHRFDDVFDDPMNGGFEQREEEREERGEGRRDDEEENDEKEDEEERETDTEDEDMGGASGDEEDVEQPRAHAAESALSVQSVDGGNVRVRAQGEQEQIRQRRRVRQVQHHEQQRAQERPVELPDPARREARRQRQLLMDAERRAMAVDGGAVQDGQEGEEEDEQKQGDTDSACEETQDEFSDGESEEEEMTQEEEEDQEMAELERSVYLWNFNEEAAEIERPEEQEMEENGEGGGQLNESFYVIDRPAEVERHAAHAGNDQIDGGGGVVDGLREDDADEDGRRAQQVIQGGRAQRGRHAMNPELLAKLKKDVEDTDSGDLWKLRPRFRRTLRLLQTQHSGQRQPGQKINAHNVVESVYVLARDVGDSELRTLQSKTRRPAGIRSVRTFIDQNDNQCAVIELESVAWAINAVYGEKKDKMEIGNRTIHCDFPERECDLKLINYDSNFRVSFHNGNLQEFFSDFLDTMKVEQVEFSTELEGTVVCKSVQQCIKLVYLIHGMLIAGSMVHCSPITNA